MRYTAYCDEYLFWDTLSDTYTIFETKLDTEVNKAGSFVFTIYENNNAYDILTQLNSIVTVYEDESLIFRGRILNSELGFYNEKQVTCEGELAFLNDIIQRPFEFNGTPAQLFTQFITTYNAEASANKQVVVGTVTVTDGDTTNADNIIYRSESEYMTVWQSINQKLIDTLGGYLQVRHENNSVYIDYLSDFTTYIDQKIEFSKNLADISKTVKGEDIATAIIPLGAKLKDEDGQETGERLTIRIIDDYTTSDICKSGDYVYSTTAVSSYGGLIFKTIIFDDVTLASNLESKAIATLSTQRNLLNSIEISAVDLHGIDNTLQCFKIGNYIQVSSEPHNINDEWVLIQKLSLNLLNPTSNTLTLGLTFESFTDQNQRQKLNYDNLVKNIQNNTQGNINAAVTQLERRVYSSVDQTAENIRSEVSDAYYTKDEAETLRSEVSTSINQTRSDITFEFNQFKSDVDGEFDSQRQWIRFQNGQIELGEVNNDFKLTLDNEEAYFTKSGVPVSTWRNQEFQSTIGRFTNQMRIGDFAFVVNSDGSVSFKKVVG